MLPWVIKILGVVGTIALLLVAGGIFLHNVEYLHHLVENLPTPAIVNKFSAGILGGVIMVLVITLVKKIISLFKK